MPRAPEKRSETRPVAVIDIGSNSARMVIAQVLPDGTTDALERLQRTVRLGHDTFVTGRLSQESMNATIAILRDYKRILDTYHVSHVRAVATSAVREAENVDAFVDRVLMTVDLDIEVIETAEESRLTVSAVREALGDRLGVTRSYALIVEVGGGSAVLTILQKGEIAASESYNLGSIRLQEMLSTSEESGTRAADLLRHHIENTVAAAKRAIPLSKVRSFFAIGGDARFAAQQVGKQTTSPEVSAISLRDFDRLVDRCVEHTVEELARIYGLAFSEAETLAPALLAYQVLLGATQARRMNVSRVSMRDGLLLDAARYVMGKEDAGLAESVLRTAKTIGERYRYDETHGHHVAELAAHLFDELQPEHGLTPRHRLLLQVAAILHEIGGFVSGRAHHKHAYYLISNTEIYGLRPEDVAIVAHVARYHRRSCPKSSHIDYMTLPREQRIVVNKLAAILRVADALDRGHAQQIRDFSVERRPGELILVIRGVPDLNLEKHALQSKGDLFEDIYGLKLRLEQATSPSRRVRRQAIKE